MPLHRRKRDCTKKKAVHHLEKGFILIHAARVRGVAVRWFKFMAAGGILAMATGCATHYVDTALKDVEVRKAANPRPVQLVFEFQTNGVPNGRATEGLKTQVTDLTKESGLFASVGTEPVAGGALLHLTLNNVALTNDAAKKGFVTGLTFGLAGNVVTDGYICTVAYLPGPTGAKITKEVRHAIHTTIGAKEAPPNAVAAKSIQDALTTVLRESLHNAFNNLSTDPSFN